MLHQLFCIGDVHGCATALRSVVEALAPSRGDKVILLGDIIDRGPDSRAVVELLLDLATDAEVTCIRGNHEEMLLNCLDGSFPYDRWIEFGGGATLDSYQLLGNPQSMPESHIDFLRSTVDFVETESHFFLHANYDPKVPIALQDPSVSRWRTLHEQIPLPHVSGKIALLGHTPNRSGSILDLGYLKNIDTYCYGGGWLTALELTTGQCWQANQQGSLRIIEPAF